MASGHNGVVLREVHRLFGEGTVAGLSEGQLLERFLARRDEVAFEALVARHGPMVLGVCRGVLRDPHEAEDAFQATFLVLIRKAGTIRRGDSLGPWLYRIARRVAVRASAGGSRRRGSEVQAAEAVAAAPAPDGPDRDARALIHEELDRLPEKYRAPIVLCYLEGRTHEEAARQLRWPIGSVKGRLSRARGLLRDRLTRRGLALSGVAPAFALEGEAGAAVPPALSEATIRAAMDIAAGKATGFATATTAALAEGVLKAMFANKLKGLAAGVLAVGLLAAGVGPFVRGGRADDGPGGAGEARGEVVDPAAIHQDREVIRGNWKVVSVEVAGKEVLRAPASGRYSNLIIGDGRFRLDEATPPAAFKYLLVDATYELDPFATPKEISLRGRRGYLSEAQLGIYRWDGETLTLCFDRIGSRTRPKAFATGAGAAQTLLLLRRETFGVTDHAPPAREAAEAEMPPPARGTPAADELARLQGTWICTRMELGGGQVALPSQALASEVKGNRWVTKRDGRALGHSSIIVTDPTRTPKEIDLVSVIPGRTDGPISKGIYRLDGDELTLCLNTPSMPERPKTFATTPNDGLQLITLERDREGRRPPSPRGLAGARLEAARKRLDTQRTYYDNGTITIDRYLDASRRVLEYELALGRSPADRLAALRAHRDRVEEITKRERRNLQGGTGSQPNLAEAEDALADAEYRLATEGAGGEGAQPAVAERNDDDARSRLLLARLDAKVSFAFEEVALDDALRAISLQVKDADFPNGIPVYVDPIALRETGRDTRTPVRLDLREMPLKEALPRILGQFNLTYTVRDGVLLIEGPSSARRRGREGH
jgi:RNA polymerase sigma factor (sigma-70 family)